MAQQFRIGVFIFMNYVCICKSNGDWKTQFEKNYFKTPFSTVATSKAHYCKCKVQKNPWFSMPHEESQSIETVVQASLMVGIFR